MIVWNYLWLGMGTLTCCYAALAWVRSWFQDDPEIPAATVVRTAEPERAPTPLGPGDMLASLFFLPVLAASIAWFCVIAAVFFSPLILIWMALQ